MTRKTLLILCYLSAIVLVLPATSLAIPPERATPVTPPISSPQARADIILLSDARFLSSDKPVRVSLPRSATSLANIQITDATGHTWSLADAIDFLGYEYGVSSQVLLTLAEMSSGVLTSGTINAQARLSLMGLPQEEISSVWDQIEQAAAILGEAFYAYYGGQAAPTATLRDGTVIHLEAGNAATYALLSYLARMAQDGSDWSRLTSQQKSTFQTTFASNFGDPDTGYLQAPHPTTADLAAMPTLKLPWAGGDQWNFNAGPHGAYLQALDFQPVGNHGCTPNIVPNRYVAAAAPGKMTADIIPYFLVIDHDGDGDVNTGWQTVYGHTANRLKQPGQMISQGDYLGSPSCLGGDATGVHLHFAIKYRNIYQAISGQALSGWIAHNGQAAYHGTLTKSGDPASPRESAWHPGDRWDFSRAQMTSDNWRQSDATPPTSHVLPIQGPIPANQSAHIAWEGSAPEPGTGIAGFSVQYRQGITGTWTGWLTDTTLTSASFGPTQPVTLKPGYTYYLRSRATDRAGNTEAYPDGNGDAQFTVLAPSDATEQIVNGEFESGEGWEIPQTVCPATYARDIVHGGQRSMRVGIVDPAKNIYSYSSAQQTIRIPADVTQATLRAWLYPLSGDPAPTALARPIKRFGGPEALGITSSQDTQYVIVLDASGQWIDTLLWQCTNDRQWALHTFDLSKYAGQVITLRFGAYNAGSGSVTAMYVDDVSVRVGQATPPEPSGGAIAFCLPLIYQRGSLPPGVPTPTPVTYPHP